MGFERLEDARKVQRVLAKRCARFGLEINAEKTRLVRFKRPPYRDNHDDHTGEGPGTFDFLGFTHRWKRSKKGTPVMQHGTSSKRLTRALNSLRQWLAENRHQPVIPSSTNKWIMR